MSRTGKRKERGLIRWLQSGSTETCSVGVLCIWQLECGRTVVAGMLGCRGEDCGMIMLHAACELKYHDMLLSACPQHRMVLVASFKSANDIQKVAPHMILLINISPCLLSFRPLP